MQARLIELSLGKRVDTDFRDESQPVLPELVIDDDIVSMIYIVNAQTHCQQRSRKKLSMNECYLLKITLFCQDHVIYFDQLHIPKETQSILDEIPTDEKNDRKFCKILFEVCFTDQYLAHMCSKGFQKSKTQAAILESADYFIMNGNLIFFIGFNCKSG